MTEFGVYSKGTENYVFYIYAPVWRENSAGVKVLHYLCDYLNSLNFNSWMVIHNPDESDKKINSELNTPVLTCTLRDSHNDRELIPIVIYSETVVGNPLKAANVIRYYLNYPGALGGSKRIPEKEFLLAYSENIAQSLTQDVQVLFIPAVKSKELPIHYSKDSKLNLVYAGKYRAFVGEPLFDYQCDVQEIFRDGKLKLSRKDVLELLANANSLFVWENSTIATEAILLDTPVYFIPNPFLGRIIAEKELGKLGYRIGGDPTNLIDLRNQIPAAKENFIKIEENLMRTIQSFANAMIADPKLQNQQIRKIRIPHGGRIINLQRVRMLFSVLHHSGPKVAIRIVKEFGYNQIRK